MPGSLTIALTIDSGHSDPVYLNVALVVALISCGSIVGSWRPCLKCMARDRESLGLYIARSLSYQGVAVDISSTRSHRRRSASTINTTAYQIIHGGCAQQSQKQLIPFSRAAGERGASTKLARRTTEVFTKRLVKRGDLGETPFSRHCGYCLWM